MFKRINCIFVTYINWSIFVLFVCMQNGIADSETSDAEIAEGNFHVETNKLTNDAQTYATTTTEVIPIVGDIVYQVEDNDDDDANASSDDDLDDDTDNENNYQKVSNHVAKFNNHHHHHQHHHQQQQQQQPEQQRQDTENRNINRFERQRYNNNGNYNSIGSHSTSHMIGANNKWMDRLMGHKRWGEATNPVKHHHRMKHKVHSNHRTKHHRSGLRQSHYQTVERHENKYHDKYDKIYSTNNFDPDIDRQDKWSILPKLTYYQGTITNDMPPYLKKYNKRNKQLLNLLEGTMAPPPPPPPPTFEYYAKIRSHNHHKKAKWIEKNLFEEQRTNRNLNTTSTGNRLNKADKNALPGENDKIDDNDIMEKRKPHAREPPPVTISPSKMDNFMYHRVASPKLVGAGSYGLLRKQRLPFVAITDKRLGHSSNRAGYSQ